MWAPSLMTGRVCRLSVSHMCYVLHCIYEYIYIYIYIYIHTHTMYFQNMTYEVLNIHYVQGICQSRLSTADYALFLVAFATTEV
jgi:hypothetical protein